MLFGPILLRALVSREWFDVSNPFLWMNPDPRDQTAFEVLLRGMALGHMARSSPERILKVLDDEAFFSLTPEPQVTIFRS
ncbi:hypothetical protein BC829DRAFT_442307 [Chytridium lagenaria]|nr:hypothetical protein BC829DRAFT_442307 [Chytridium lagenaria]